MTTISASSAGISASTVLTVRVPPHVYIADGTNINVCSINMVDGSLTGCAATGTGFQGPFGIVLTGGLAYVSNGSIATGQSVSVCNVASEGTLTGCALTAANIGIPQELAVNGATFYVADGSGPVCPINVDGTLGTCTASVLPSGAFPLAVSVVGNHAYVGDRAAGIYLCAVSPADGSLSNCTVSNGGASYNAPTEISIY